MINGRESCEGGLEGVIRARLSNGSVESRLAKVQPGLAPHVPRDRSSNTPQFGHAYTSSDGLLCRTASIATGSADGRIN